MSADRTAGARRWAILPVAEPLKPAPDSIVGNVDYTAVLAGDDGEQMTLDLVGGVIYPFRPSQVISTTAPIYGLYNASK